MLVSIFRLFTALSVSMAVVAFHSAHAASVNAVLESVGSGVWTTQFTLNNSAAQAPVGSFSVYFDWGGARNFSLLDAPAGWDVLLFQADDGLQAGGFMDALAVDPLAAIAPGASQGGFKIQFEWAQLSLPAQLLFTINDDQYRVVETGAIDLRALTVPEPSTLVNALGGLVVLGLLCMPKRRHSWKKKY